MQFINIHGSPLNIDRMKATAPKRQVSAPDQDAEYHKGFRVMGHPPGALESARDDAIKATNRWASMGADTRKQALGDGEREPKPWDEAIWRSEAKLKAVRSKPYELEAGANACATLAAKAGWIDVRVVAVKLSKDGA